MNRRGFLKTTGLGIAAAGLGLTAPWPGFVARAFGDEPAPLSRAHELGEAVARAKRDGKSLLILLVPDEPDQRWDRGRLFGEVINHGGSEVHDDLLVCEVACATLDETRSAVGPLDVKGEPIMLLVDLDGEGRPQASVTAIAPAIPARTVPSPKLGSEDESAIKERIAVVAKALRETIRPSADSLEERANRNRTTLPADDRTAVEEIIAGKREPHARLVRRGAPMLLVAASKGEGQARRALDAAAAELIVKARPAGAQWASSAGCGTTIEGVEEQMMVACGMGAVHALSQRFLHFYANP